MTSATNSFHVYNSQFI
uniref:Uncharacterized protein n=1 Tax=Rhizophora mucronata TaxID=61149 RepID=A0A2P2IZT9_RHIMU